MEIYFKFLNDEQKKNSLLYRQVTMMKKIKADNPTSQALVYRYMYMYILQIDIQMNEKKNEEIA